VSEEAASDAALSRIARALRSEQASIDRDDLALVLTTTERWLSSRVYDAQLRHDVAVEAFYRLAHAARSGHFDDGRPVGAWLRVVAQRVAIDYARRDQRRAGDQPLRVDVANADDEIARLLDGVVSADRIRHGLKVAVDAGDYETVRLLATWLDLAERQGGVPPSREVAEITRVSHMQVQRALRRFRRYLDI
jgi:DNA-directed RNA polymerase specialized sigma24 family protein